MDNVNQEQASGIIDMHAHILPGLDDGAEDMQETKAMLQQAYTQGIRGIIATPHYKEPNHRVDAAVVRAAAEAVQNIAREIASDLNIYVGQEIYYFTGITEALDSGRVLPLSGTKAVLVEFFEGVSYQELYQSVRNMMLDGYTPVLAHVERYACLRKAGCIDELIQTGALMQMNYSSLVAGMRYLGEQMWCRKMVLAGKIHLLGTDMHRMNYRPPEIRKAILWLREKAGETCFEQLTRTNPVRLLRGDALI
ncbi:MAG: CpsB/CapC family capsule biosynthesis tyrosine phosphatase [Clostridium sp.]